MSRTWRLFIGLLSLWRSEPLGATLRFAYIGTPSNAMDFLEDLTVIHGAYDPGMDSARRTIRISYWPEMTNASLVSAQVVDVARRHGLTIRELGIAA